MVIVTKNQYIIASKIYHITLNENYEYHNVKTNSGSKDVKETFYEISVSYSPEATTNSSQPFSNRDDIRDCTVVIRGKVDAYKVYKTLIEQIREQNPDQLFLDKALETLLSTDDLAQIGIDENKDYQELRTTKTRPKRKDLLKARRNARGFKKAFRKLKKIRKIK